jgi:hypothetical protein
MVLLSAAFSQQLVWCLGLFIPPPLAHLRLLYCVEVQRSSRHLEDHIQSIQVLNCSSLDFICFVYVLSARLSLELSECKVVQTLWGDSWVNQGVQGSPEALGPKWLTGNRHRPSDLVWSREDTLCGGRGDPIPWWRSSLVEVTSRWPRELGECLSGERLWRVK